MYKKIKLNLIRTDINILKCFTMCYNIAIDTEETKISRKEKKEKVKF